MTKTIGRLGRLLVGVLFLCSMAELTWAQQAGVLLSYEGWVEGRDPGSSPVPIYKTMWIVFSPGEARVVATVPDIIAPRATGFWRLGRTNLCEFSPPPSLSEGESGTDGTRDVLWQVPLNTSPVVEQGPACKNHNPGDQEDSGGEVMLCDLVRANYLFVSPGYYSGQYEFSQTEACEPRGSRQTYRSTVKRFEGESPVTLTDLFGVRAAAAYETAAEKGFVELSKEMNCPEPDSESLDSWVIQHRRGRWHAFAALNSQWGDCAFDQELELALPRRVTSESAGAEDWKKFASAIPDLEDFYLSPMRDYALVLTSKPGNVRMFAYSVKEGMPDRKLLEIPWSPHSSPGPPIVMAQWASEPYVPAWTDVILKIHDHPLPAPRVVVSQRTGP